MKKIISTTLLFLSVLLISACSPSNNEQKGNTTTTEAVSQTVTIALKEDGQELSSKKVTIKKNDTLFETMKNNFEIKDQDGFITEIDNHVQDEKANKYWTYTINDQPVLKGAKEIQLKAEDRIIFDLAAQ